MPNRLFSFAFHVVPTGGQTMPEEATGALVPCYAGGTGPEAAMARAAAVLRDGGYAIVDVEGGVRELDVEGWSGHVARCWPEFAGGLPGQDGVRAIVDAGEAFFGPFLGYTE